MRVAPPVLCAAVASLCLASPAAGVDRDRALTQLGIDVWHLRQGLPQGTVTAITQTRDGYLWLGTEEGLARFDGVRFSIFDRRNTPALRQHNVVALRETRDGSLWIGTLGGGLKRRQGTQFTSFTTENGFPENIVSALAEDSTGALWAGTFSRGVVRLRGNRFTRLTTKNGLPSDEIRALHQDAAGGIWIGSRGGGVSLWRDGRLMHWSTRNGLSNDQVTAICDDGEGGVWVATRDGLNRITGGRVLSFFEKDGLSNDAVIALHRDLQGTLWIGTVGGGLARFRDGRFDALRKPQGLANDTVRALAEDREGNLWVGTSGGLHRLRSGAFATFGKPEGLSEDDVRPVFEDREGNLWIGTLGGGLNRRSAGRWTAYTKNEGLASDRVWALHQDRAGALWVGTREGLSRLADGRWTTFTVRDGLANDLVLSIGEDREGSLWIGTAGGLTRRHDGKLQTFTTKDGLSNDRICVIATDAYGTVWLGTMGGGLSRIRGGRIEAVGGPVAASFISAIHPDANGTLWVGTSGDGLHRLRNGRWTAYTTSEGLFDNVAYSILDDGAGNLWMSSNRGVYRTAKSDLDRFAEGKARFVRSMAFDTADGMKESECNGGFQPAGWRTRDGRLWFATVRGATVVDPARLAPPAAAPPAFVEQVLADHELAPLQSGVRFPPGKGRFEFHYTALSFAAPERLRFKFRLEGFDPDWVEAGTRRVAYYTNIPAGTYTFRVAAANRDGPWNEQGDGFRFELRRFFYRSYWFLSLVGVVLLLAAAWMHRARMRAARLQSELAAARLEALKAQIQPHFLFNTLNMVLPLIYRDPDSASRTLVQLGDLLRSSLERDATRLVPLRAELDFLNKYLDIQLVRFQSRLIAEFQVDDDMLEAAVPNLILQPLVENAIKHGIAKQPGSGRVDITCRREGKCLLLRVWNTAGLEMPTPADVSNGVGLSNIRERLDVIYGARNYRFSRGRGDGGYEVTIRLPLRFIEEDAETAETLRTMPHAEGEGSAGELEDSPLARLARKAR